MMIREFHSKFWSVDESSVLFAALRRLTLLDEVASLSVAEMSWVEWPPMDPSDPTASPGSGLRLAGA